MSLAKKPADTSSVETSDFVADGEERLVEGIEADVRRQVEQQYADEWNASGIIRRLFLVRKIERETAEQVADRLRDISPDCLY